MLLCVKNTQVSWYGVEATAANHIHSFVQGLSVVLQLHTLQKLSECEHMNHNSQSIQSALRTAVTKLRNNYVNRKLDLPT